MRYQQLGKKHPDTLLAMANLARTNLNLGEAREAQKLEVQVLELRKKILGGERPDTLLRWVTWPGPTPI